MLQKTNTMEQIELEPINQHHDVIFYKSEEFWVAMAFVLVVVALFIPIKKAIKSILQNRVNRIVSDLQNAENLKLEAQELYSKHERNLLKINDKISEIILNEEAVINETKERKIKELNNMLNQKQKEVDSKIEGAYIRADKQIKKIISQKVDNVLKESIKLTQKEHIEFINKSIDNLENIDFKKV